MYRLEAGILIEAPSHQVWAILTDFSTYSEWNPFVREVRGEAVDGRSLSIAVQTDAKHSRRLWSRVRSSQPPWELCSRGSFLAAFLLRAEHRFRLQSQPDGSTHLTQSLSFAGLLAPVYRRRVMAAAGPGFAAMNQALKTRAEARR